MSTSAGFHAVTPVAIGLPLLWEASTRFALLAPASGAVAIGLFAAAALTVAWYGRVHSLATVTTLATIAVAAGLMGRTGAFVPYAWVLVTIGLAALWLGYDRDWYWVHWVTALVADVALLGVTTRALKAASGEPAGPVIALLLARPLTREMIRSRLETSR